MSPDDKYEFKEIAQAAAVEASKSISEFLGQAVELNFSRLIDSSMTSDKIIIKNDSLLVTASIKDYGPLSLIISNIHALNLSNLFKENNGEKTETELKEEDQQTLAKLCNEVVNSVITFFMNSNKAAVLEVVETSSKSLKAEDPASLELPAGVVDSMGMGFKIKTSSGLEASIQIETNTKLIDFLAKTLVGLRPEAREGLSTEETSAESDAVESETTVATKDQARTTTDDETINPSRNLKFMRHVNMELVLELGRSEMPMKDILTLTRGSAIELDRPCDRPVDLYVHNQLIARGEVVAIDDNFGIKIVELVGNLDVSQGLEALML